jgi:hypothetical protein
MGIGSIQQPIVELVLNHLTPKIKNKKLLMQITFQTKHHNFK